MRASGADAAALTALATITQALAQLEAGDLAVCAFGDDVNMIRRFGDPRPLDARAADAFRFDQRSTDVVALLRAALPELRDARRAASGRAHHATCLQLALVVSDGHFDSGSRNHLRRLHRDAADDGIALVLVLIDRPGRESLTEMKLVTFDDGLVQTTPYLDNFPFPCYVLLRDVAALPETLALALKQWFEFFAAHRP
mmetsp:Transcript_11009/g.35033  ORF Transcript_11009/g.35033 Transcript_11009/m.35033 type:complete len:198 (+) Transcript_11009:1-594(+)